MKKISNRGLTLLELLIVMVILATSLGLGVSFINRQENSIKKAFRQLIALNRQLDSTAKLNKTIYRLVINMDDEDEPTWWVEQKTDHALLSTTDFSDKENTDSSKETTAFITAPGFFEEPQYLPGDLQFTGIEYSKNNQEVLSGTAYIYYFPEGQTSQILLRLKSEKKHWSLFIDRFHGELTVFSGKKILADLQRQ